MQHESALAVLARLSAPSLGVFRGTAATEAGVSRKQVARLRANGEIVRLLPDTYRIVAAMTSNEQALRAALLWAGDRAAAAGCSAGELYRFEGVRAAKPEIVVPRSVRATDLASWCATRTIETRSW